MYYFFVNYYNISFFIEKFVLRSTINIHNKVTNIVSFYYFSNLFIPSDILRIYNVFLIGRYIILQNSLYFFSLKNLYFFFIGFYISCNSPIPIYLLEIYRNKAMNNTDDMPLAYKHVRNAPILLSSIFVS